MSEIKVERLPLMGKPVGRYELQKKYENSRYPQKNQPLKKAVSIEFLRNMIEQKDAEIKKLREENNRLRDNQKELF